MDGKDSDAKFAALEAQVADLQEQVVVLFKYQASLEKTVQVLLENADMAMSIGRAFEAFMADTESRWQQEQQQKQQKQKETVQPNQQQQQQQRQQQQPAPQDNGQVPKWKPPGKPKPAAKAPNQTPKKRKLHESYPMSNEVRLTRMKIGACLKCGQKGHMIADCQNEFNAGECA